MKEQISFRTGEKHWKLAPVLVIAAGICWGIIGLFSYGLKDAGLSALQIAALRCLTAGLCLGGFLLLTDCRLLRVHPRDFWMFVGTGVVSFALFNTLLLGLVSTLMPFLLYTKGLHHMETGKASILTFVEPMVATVLSSLVFREAFRWNHALGMTVILAALVILNLPARQSTSRRATHTIYYLFCSRYFTALRPAANK